MLADLDGHRPEKIEFCLTEAQKEMFKDVLVLCEGAKSADEPIKVLHDKFMLSSQTMRLLTASMMISRFTLSVKSTASSRRMMCQSARKSWKPFLLRSRR